MSSEARSAGHAAIVLAAGASSRMGRSKARLQWKGRSFVEHCVRAMVDSGADDVVVISGADKLEGLDLSPARRIHNKDWSLGQLSSLQCGLRALREGPVLVTTVDRPRVAAHSLAALVNAARENPNFTWQPSFEGKRGHPILWSSEAAQALRGLEVHGQARELWARPHFASRRASVEVDDPTILENLDRPEDLLSL